MGMEIAGRTALLTGATGGLGRAIAEGLADDGATLVLSGRREEDLLALAESLPGSDHRVVVADLAEDGEAERLAAAAAGRRHPRRQRRACPARAGCRSSPPRR